MSRAAVFDALANDPTLNAIGINADSIWHNFSLEERPNATGPFIILRWGTQAAPYWQTVNAPETLTLWGHLPIEVTEDYSQLKKLLDDVDDVFISLRDVVGSDGYTLSFVRRNGRSADFKDDGFQTISKNSMYQIFYRKAV